MSQLRTWLRLRITAGDSATLLPKVKSGTFDLWLGINAKQAEELKKEGLAQTNERFVYAAQCKLLLWSSNISEVDVAGSVLGRAHIRSIAVVARDKDPHGEASAQLLDTLNMSQQLTPKLRPTDGLAQALEAAHTDQVDLAFVTLAQVLLQGRVASGSLWVVPTAM